ncbi:hypothetical protein AB0C61_36310 [Streptomyces sp. NPDC048680]|uniref:hypothetical protein n=1 Tax=Streptomyces sp. NPDC048680 TaxID=3155492 RepID=UPI0034125732
MQHESEVACRVGALFHSLIEQYGPVCGAADASHQSVDRMSADALAQRDGGSRLAGEGLVQALEQGVFAAVAEGTPSPSAASSSAAATLPAFARAPCPPP